MPINYDSSIPSDSDSDFEDELFEELVKKDVEEFLNEDDAISKKKRQRYDEERVPFVSTNWSKLINKPQVWNPRSRIGKLFRRRFRLPFPTFVKLVDKCSHHNIFPPSRHLPVELKVLTCLRILGRGSCADEIKELSGELLGESTVHVLFKQFVKGIAEHLFPIHVKIPEGTYLQEVLHVYSRLGLPGAIGSMDCTHVWWAQCPKRLTFDCTGKEGYPTLVFQVVVDHFRRINHCSRHFLGASNDKTIANNDPFTVGVMDGSLENIEYHVFDLYGEKVLAKGGYIITDNGYQDKACFMDPDHKRTTREAVLWSEWLESVRKDVECKLITRNLFLSFNYYTYTCPF